MANLSNINNKFLVTTGGNVLIGQTAVVGTSMLQVTGNSTFAGKVIANNWFQGADATNTLYSNATAGLLLQTAGATANNNDSKIFFRNSNTTVTHTFDTNTGNVGIGTDSPNSYSNQTVLTINGSTYGRLDLESGGTLRSSLFSQAANTSLTVDSGFFTIDVGGTERMRIDSSGNFGFSVVPENSSGTWRNFQIGGANLVTRENNNNDLLLGTGFYFNTANQELYRRNEAVSRMFFNNDVITFQNAASGTANTPITWSERMRIDSSGNVIINDGYLEVQKAPAAAQQTVMLDVDCNPTGNTGSSIISNRAGSSSQARSEWEQVTSGGSGSFGTYIDTNFINKGLSASAHGNINFVTGSSTSASSIVMTIGGGTQKGNVGIGTATPASKLHIEGAGQQWVSVYTTDITGAGALNGLRTQSSANGRQNTLYRNTANNLVTLRAGTDDGEINFIAGGSAAERMRITSGGDVLINQSSGATSAATLLTNGYAGFGVSGTENYIVSSRFNDFAAFFKRENSNGGVVSFKRDASTVGSVSVTTTATAYNTNSDYRLKENVVEMTGALDRVSQLKPSRFNFIADADKTVDGFLAHEVQEIVPEAISGEKDAMQDEEYEVSAAIYEDVIHPAIEEELDDDGNIITEAKEEWTESVLVSEAVKDTRQVPDYQGIDQSKLVPLLVAAIQELKAEIELLKSK